MSTIYNMDKVDRIDETIGPLTPRKMNKKKLSPYMYLIHDNMKKEELVSKYQSFISEKHNQSLGLRGRAKSSYNKQGAAKLPFQPHYNHDQKKKSLGHNSSVRNDDDLDLSNISKKHNTHQTDGFSQTTKKVTPFNKSHNLSESPHRNKDNSTKKKTMGTSLRARYEKLRDILEERNEELEKERLTFFGCIQKIKDLREKYFGESEAYFVDQNENATHSFDKEYCALDLVIEQEMTKNNFNQKNMQEMEQKIIQQEKQKLQSAISEMEKERKGEYVKMVEKEKVIQELHKALSISGNDVEVLSREIQQLQAKNREQYQQITQQQDSNRKMLKRVNEYKKVEEYGTTNVLVQQEIDHLKSSKSDIERKYYELKHKMGDIQKLKEDNINLKLELDHRVKDLKVDNEKRDREYQILLKEYKTLKAKCKQLEEDTFKSVATSQAKNDLQALKDQQIQKQYYESKISALTQENEQTQTQLNTIKSQYKDLASLTYTKEEVQKITVDNNRQIKILEDKINDLSFKNKSLLIDQLASQRLKEDLENMKQLYDQEKMQNKELKQKIAIQDNAYTEYQQQQHKIHLNLTNQLNSSQHQIESIKHQQTVSQQSRNNDDDNDNNLSLNRENNIILPQSQQKNSNSRLSHQSNNSNYSNKDQTQYNNKNNDLREQTYNKSSNNIVIPQSIQNQKNNSYDNENQYVQKNNSNNNKSSNNIIIPQNSNNINNYTNSNINIKNDDNNKINVLSQNSHIRSSSQYSAHTPQKSLKDSMTNLSQKQKKPVQFTDNDQVKSHSSASRKQSSAQQNNSALKNQGQHLNNNSNNVDNKNVPQESFIIKTYVNTDQTHERRKQRSQSQMSNYKQQQQQHIEEFDGPSEEGQQEQQQYSKLEKEDLQTQKKLNQLKQERKNNRKSFHTNPDQDVKYDF